MSDKSLLPRLIISFLPIFALFTFTLLLLILVLSEVASFLLSSSLALLNNWNWRIDAGWERTRAVYFLFRVHYGLHQEEEVTQEDKLIDY